MTTDNDSHHYRLLAETVRYNLENQQDWIQLRVHCSEASAARGADAGDTGRGEAGRPKLPRILLSGLPPRRMYIHPDEQIEILRAELALGNGWRMPQPPEYEWVLPMHLAEQPTVGLFASVFDAIGALPPGAEEAEAAHTSSSGSDGDGDSSTRQWMKWRRSKRRKRLLLAIVQDDSSVVYYFMHDGIVKPRQN